MSDQSLVNTSPLVAIVRREDGSTYALPAFVWDVNREQAAVDLAEGQLSVKQIADRAGTHAGIVRQWLDHPHFKTRVDECKARFRAQVMEFGLTQREVRMAYRQKRHERLREIINARAGYYEQFPEAVAVSMGCGTGFVVERQTKYGTEYRTDKALLDAFSELEKDAAIEVGEWNEGAVVSQSIQIVVPSRAPDAGGAQTVTIGRAT